MKLEDYKHELNSFIFKLEASAQLLKEPEKLSEEEIEAIGTIILHNTKKLKLFFECFTILEKGKGHTLNEHKLKQLTEEILSVIDNSMNIKASKKSTVFSGNFSPRDKIDRFLLECLEQLFSEKGIAIKDKEIEISW